MREHSIGFYIYIIVCVIIFLFFVYGVEHYKIDTTITSTDTISVEALITDAKYRESYSLLTLGANGSLIPIVKPAQYNITVYYNGELYTYNNKIAYNKYKGCIGENLWIKLKTEKQHNGKEIKYIIDIP